MNLKKLHYFSGITISIFVGMHLFNHLYSLVGIDVHIALMNNLRLVYRNFIVESVLVLAVIIQIYSGIKLFINKRKTASGFFEKLKVWSGAYLAFFLIIHLGAVFTGRLVLNLDTNFYFGVAGINTFPFNLFFIPYYGLAIVAFFGHISAVHSTKMKHKIIGIEPDKQSYIILTFGLLLSLVILYGLTNGFNGVEIPSEYKILIGK